MPGQQAGDHSAGSSTDVPAAGPALKPKRKSWEMLLAEIIEEAEDEDPPVPPGEEHDDDDYEAEIEQGKAAWNAAYSIKPGPHTGDPVHGRK